MEPEFHHIEKEQLPKWEENGADFTLIAGEGYARKSPVPVHSPLFMIEVKTSNETPLQIIDQVKGNIMAYGEKIEEGNMIVSKTEDACKVTIAPNSHLLLFGGEAFPEERFIFWNFVASSQETIEKAKLRWKNK
ncbi:pirin-like C-terminal cupin domain-containing protein [Galbibacter pacificus]|uniref:pirin-like C-terminal cupin domain-containing protein n=1 Tax=Galbibacter pacificus TaxID=2996052 RepID=UPI0038B292B3